MNLYRTYKKIKIVLLLSLTSFIYSCQKDFLDTVPDNLVTLDDVFTKHDLSIQWLNRVYNSIPDPWFQGIADDPMPGGASQWQGMTDELDYSFKVMPINQGALTGNNSWHYWFYYYKSIRYAGVFIENIHRNEELTNLNNGSQLMQQYIGEARFLRAYYYWQLMKIYGPIPILGDAVLPIDADFQLPRNTWDECVEFILTQLDIAKNEVAQIGTTHELGRINNAVVLAIKAEVLLYHASPLFNGNTDFQDLMDINGRQLLSSPYDLSKWQRAADAAKETIDLIEGHHSLYQVQNTDPFMAGYLSTRNLFWDGWRTEGIWVRPVSTQTPRWERYNAPRFSQGRGYSVMGVSQTLVDKFRMANGREINENGSGYIGTGLHPTAKADFYRNNISNMYVGREPRFYVNITFNGSTIPVQAQSGRAYVYFFNKGDNGKPTSAIDWPRTGYSPRKNIHPTTSWASPVVQVERPAMLIRVAEVYLNYVEALNEYQPGHPDILLYLNKIRERGGIAPLVDGLDQNEMRRQIRLERQIELCFEGQRYFDVRRWKTAENPNSGDYQGGAMYGMNMDKGETFEDQSFYERVVATRRTNWERRNYFWPIPQADLERNTALTQNPGY